MSKERPFCECTQFDTCSCNNCPLDPDSEDRNSYPEEDKCKVRKKTRAKIGMKYPEVLKYKGLRGNEYVGMEKWGSIVSFFNSL